MPSCLRRLFRCPGFLLAFCLLAACGDVEDSIYHGHRCSFVFDTTLHPAPCHLTSAMGNMGHFLTVTTYLKEGVRYIKTTRNYDQQRDSFPLLTKREAQTQIQLGANNAIIVGRSSYTSMFMAYEGQCRNCMENYGGVSYPLTWSKNGQQLTCGRCHRSYDVNNGVVAAGEGGRPLYIYNIALENGILRVWN